MPYIGLGLHVLVALFFAIHALRSGRQMYWLFILFTFPLLGSVAYFFVEYLPELRFNRAARGAAHAVTKFINPDRELRDAQRAFDQAATVGNRIRLAQALLGKGDAPGESGLGCERCCTTLAAERTTNSFFLNRPFYWGCEPKMNIVDKLDFAQSAPDQR